MRRASRFAAIVILATLSVAADGPKRTFGQPLSTAPNVELTSLAKNAGAYVGKSVRVAGVVVQVDEKGGWVEVSNDIEGMPMRIRIPSGVTDFPADAKGKHVIAEGTVAKISPSGEAGGGAVADGLTAEAPSPREVIYEIRAIGLVLG